MEHDEQVAAFRHMREGTEQVGRLSAMRLGRLPKDCLAACWTTCAC
jgi:hypothetical protein